jgi:hypothetical protein
MKSYFHRLIAQPAETSVLTHALPYETRVAARQN